MSKKSHENKAFALDMETMKDMLDSHFANVDSFSTYQKYALKTAVYPYKGKNIYYPALGLGEVGEIQNQVKKIMRDDGYELTNERKEKIISEMGDVLWYLSAVAYELDITLQSVARKNLIKLFKRMEAGTIRGDDRNE